MKGDPKVIEQLQHALKLEFTAIHQYWGHALLLADWGYREMAKRWEEEYREEMGHANRFMDRIIFFEGVPNVQDIAPVRLGSTIVEVLENDLAAEHEARTAYLEAARLAESVNDRGTKNLFEEILADEEGHIDFLETELELAQRIGNERYGQRRAGHVPEE